MDLRHHMDALLANIAEQGREPQRFIVREEDWRELIARYELHPDPEADDVTTYQGVPVEFGQVTDRMIVALYDTAGQSVVKEG